MSQIKIWQRVPDGSRLEISVEPKKAGGDHPWTSQAEILDDLGAARTLEDDELTPGPAVHPLASPRLYDARVRVVLAGEGEGTIHARVRKPPQPGQPEGDVFGSPFAFPFKGGAGDVVRVTLGVITLKS